MTKGDIAEAVYEKLEGAFAKKDVADLVDMVFELMKDTLDRCEELKVSGFGRFVVKAKNQRMGRNPKTGDAIAISARRVVTFKPSQVLKKALNPC